MTRRDLVIFSIAAIMVVILFGRDGAKIMNDNLLIWLWLLSMNFLIWALVLHALFGRQT